MVNFYVVYDCVFGNDIIIVNSVVIVGYVYMDDYVIVGGVVGIYQFCKIGVYLFLGVGGIILCDVFFFVMVSGQKNIFQGINFEGFKCCGFSKEEVMVIKCVYKVIYCEGNIVDEVIEKFVEFVQEFFGVVFMVKFL